MFWGHHMGFGGWSLLFNGLLWIGFIVLGVWVIAKLFPGAGGNQRQQEATIEHSRSPEPAPDTALQILQRRYARGELTKEEYETIRHDLSQ